MIVCIFHCGIEVRRILFETQRLGVAGWCGEVLPYHRTLPEISLSCHESRYYLIHQRNPIRQFFIFSISVYVRIGEINDMKAASCRKVK